MGRRLNDWERQVLWAAFISLAVFSLCFASGCARTVVGFCQDVEYLVKDNSSRYDAERQEWREH